MLKRIGVVIYTFMILFYPPVFGIRGLRILAVVSWVFIFINIRKISKVCNWRKIVSVYLSSIIGILYIIFVGILNNNSIIPSIAGFIYCLIALLPSGLLVSFYMRVNNYSMFDFSDVVLQAALLQSIICIAAFIVPSFKNTLILWMIDGHVFEENTYSSWAIALRLFGYSTGLTYGMPILQAFLVIVSIYLAFEKDFVYMFYAPFLFFSAFINSRTSAIVVVVCLLVFPIKQSRKLNTRIIIRSVLTLGVMIGAIIVLPSIVEQLSPATYSWIKTGYGEILRFTQGDSSNGYFYYLTDAVRWRIPEGIHFLFGTGIRVMSGVNKYNLQSDIGFINDLWLGGILFIGFLYVFWIKLIFGIKDYKVEGSEEEKRYIDFLIICFSFVYFVINIKGYAFDLNNFTAFFIIVTSFCTLTKNSNFSSSRSKKFKIKLCRGR